MTETVRNRSRFLKLIAAFRMVKALVLAAIGIGAFRLLKPGVADQLLQWSSALPMLIRHPAAGHAVKTVAGMPERRIEEYALAALAYSALFATEAVGLWREKIWAEYLTIVATTSFIPFEVLEIVRHRRPLAIVVLTINVAIVIFLIVRRRKAGRQNTAGDRSLSA